MTIEQPICFSELGQRDNNEDFVIPIKPSVNDKLFIVCDGMGGLDKGEAASKIVAETIYDSISGQIYGTKGTSELIEVATNLAHEKLKSFLEADPQLNRMGSTITLLYLTENQATIAHIGDSRIYHIRNGVVLHKTIDHKQVVEMVAEGIINEEQAQSHPWRNRLSKSVSVKKHTNDEESSHKIDRPTIHETTDILPGDYFFLCSDGVLEQVTDDILCKTLTNQKSNSEKIEELLAISKDKTKDNYSGYLIQIASKDKKGNIFEPYVKVVSNNIENGNNLNKNITEAESDAENSIFKKIFFLIVLFGLIASLFWGFKYLKKGNKSKIFQKEIKKNDKKDSIIYKK